ncbi:DUF4395 domain-containing protein [Heyndrickxia acidicola]|uniref:DUF4395 domain-containing protein n=1 Tax=Heyndrickxia acidicola TaxID=209389 RepID=A0ABU6MH87_9BACI|nr:DUF4395 domain-containing protein [Heyndrickxia acidicola]MED1204041.1 DUF4395 domain-containing protein [Heyndrickxia acidicola]
MKNDTRPPSIPRPLVRVNQWTIVLSVLLTWIFQNEWILLIPFLAGLCGLLFDVNPVMKIAKYFLRKPITAYIPEDMKQQKFNQVIAVCCLAGGFISALVGLKAIFYIFTIMVALAAVIAICGFCIGCFIYFQWNQFKYRRKVRSQG